MKGLSIQAAAFGQEAKSGTIEGLDVCYFLYLLLLAHPLTDTD